MRNTSPTIRTSFRLPARAQREPAAESRLRKVLEVLAHLREQGVEEISRGQLQNALHDEVPSTVLGPLLSQLSGSDRGQGRTPRAELVRIRRGVYRLTNTEGCLATPRPSDARSVYLGPSLWHWLEQRAALGVREFTLSDAVSAMHRVGFSSSATTVRNAIAVHLRNRPRRDGEERSWTAADKPVVILVRRGEYRYVGGNTEDRTGQGEMPLPSLAMNVLQALADEAATGTTHIRSKRLAERLVAKWSKVSRQAIVRHIHSLDDLGLVSIELIGNTRSRMYGFRLTPAGEALLARND